MILREWQHPRPLLHEQIRHKVGHEQGTKHTQSGARQYVRPVVLVVRDTAQARVPGHHDEEVLQEMAQQLGSPPRHAGLQVNLKKSENSDSIPVCIDIDLFVLSIIQLTAK